MLFAFVTLALFTMACVQLPFLAVPGQQAEAVVETPTAVVEVIADTEEGTLNDLYQQVIPGVVNVQVLQLTADSELAGGAGSGFVLDNQGHIVTNAHVVRDAQLVDVVLYDDTIVPAEVVGLDDDSDLAVLKIDVPADQLIPLPLGDSDAVVPGQEVIAIGNPFGRQGSMTSGIVSAVGRTIPSLTLFSIPQAIQTDAAINPSGAGADRRR
jgi:S1-C subfamily serine protease